MSVSLLGRLAAPYPAIIALVGIAGPVLAAEGGPLALLQILWVHLALAALALVPLAAIAPGPGLRLGLVALALVFGARMGGEWLSLPPATVAGEARTLQVVSWNVELFAEPEATIRGLLAHPADLIAIQELTSELAAAIEATPELTGRYPHRALAPRPGVTGLGLLSRHPLGEVGIAVEPSRQSAVVHLPGDGPDVSVVHAHPLPARIALGPGRVPLGFDPTIRNADLALIRKDVDARIAAGETVLLIGDFNAAPTEPAFGRLTGGLRDAHAEVGQGPGWTWRPRRLAWLGIGLLRIDLVASGPGLVPLASATDCSRAVDHCLLRVTLGLEDRAD